VNQRPHTRQSRYNQIEIICDECHGTKCDCHYRRLGICIQRDAAQQAFSDGIEEDQVWTESVRWLLSDVMQQKICLQEEHSALCKMWRCYLWS
jgi:hypothetical protein